MASVWIPSLLRELCSGERVVQVPGATVRQVIENLESRCPGIRGRLVEGGELRPELAVSVDGETTQIGLLQPVGEASEVHILPALGGGAEGTSSW
jgi:molybdopterin converting factor small subunit